MAVDRSRLPSPGVPLSFTFPEVRRRTLDNGLRVCTIEHYKVPLITYFVLLPVGSAQDPDTQPGLAAITGDLLDEGSGDLDALQVHEALGRIGAHLDTEIGADATLLELTSLEQYAPRAVDLLSSMVRAPRLEQRDFDRVRELRLNRLIQLRDLPPALADRVFTELLYPGHPYGHLPIGTEGSLKAIALEDVARFHRVAYTPAHATVIAVGHASHQRLGDLIEGAFGGWQPGARSNPDLIDVSSLDISRPDGGRLATVHRPGAAQSELRIGHVGLSRRTPDYHALLVLNMVLGGQFVSRMNMNLREDKGYSYGVFSNLATFEQGGLWYAGGGVQTDKTALAVVEFDKELKALAGARPITREEFDSARQTKSRGYTQQFEAYTRIAGQIANLWAQRLPMTELQREYDATANATHEAALAAASTYATPDRALLLLVGDRAKIEGELRELQLGDVVVLNGEGTPATTGTARR